MTTTLASPSDALFVEEVRRTRAFLRVGWMIALGVAIALPLVPGDRRIAAALYALAAGADDQRPAASRAARSGALSPGADGTCSR